MLMLERRDPRSTDSASPNDRTVKRRQGSSLSPTARHGAQTTSWTGGTLTIRRFEGRTHHRAVRRIQWEHVRTIGAPSSLPGR